jgi:hypothetical protein
MAQITITSQVTEPATPLAGTVVIWPSGSTLKYKNELGQTFTLSTGVTLETVQDLLATTFADSASIEWVYDDNANTYTASVKSDYLDTVSNTINGHIANLSNPHSVTKTQVGLGSVDNTSDANKPVSTAQQAAINNAISNHNNASDPHSQYQTAPEVINIVNAHANLTNNPHGVTKSQVGLGSVPNVDARQRSTHTGTQLANTISDFDQALAAYMDRFDYSENTPYSHTSSSWDWYFIVNPVAAHTKTYKVTVSYIWSHDHIGSDFMSSLLVNNIRYDLTRQEPQDSNGNIDGFGTDQSHVNSYTLFIPLTAGSNTFRFDFRSSQNGRRAGIRKATIQIERWEA